MMAGRGNRIRVGVAAVRAGVGRVASGRAGCVLMRCLLVVVAKRGDRDVLDGVAARAFIVDIARRGAGRLRSGDFHVIVALQDRCADAHDSAAVKADEVAGVAVGGAGRFHRALQLRVGMLAGIGEEINIKDVIRARIALVAEGVVPNGRSALQADGAGADLETEGIRIVARRSRPRDCCVALAERRVAGGAAQVLATEQERIAVVLAVDRRDDPEIRLAGIEGDHVVHRRVDRGDRALAGADVTDHKPRIRAGIGVMESHDVFRTGGDGHRAGVMLRHAERRDGLRARRAAARAGVSHHAGGRFGRRGGLHACVPAVPKGGDRFGVGIAADRAGIGRHAVVRAGRGSGDRARIAVAGRGDDRVGQSDLRLTGRIREVSAAGRAVPIGDVARRRAGRGNSRNRTEIRMRAGGSRAGGVHRGRCAAAVEVDVPLPACVGAELIGRSVVADRPARVRDALDRRLAVGGDTDRPLRAGATVGGHGAQAVGVRSVQILIRCAAFQPQGVIRIGAVDLLRD